MEKVLVIIVAYNGMEWLDRCLGSLRQAGEGVDALVVDNGSTDGTPTCIASNYPEVKLVQSPKNLGFGAANNLGMRMAVENGYDYVYLLNQDAWIFPDTIPLLIAAAKRHDDYGILSPMQYSGNATTLDTGFERECGGACAAHPKQEVVPVGFAMAAHWFIPCRVIEKVGCFSPTFFHYGEDNNYVDRLRYHGYKVGVVQGAKAVHDRFERPVSREKSFYLKNTSNLIRLSRPSKAFGINLLSAAFYAMAFSLKAKSLSPLKGFVSQMKRIREIAANHKISRGNGAFFAHTPKIY